MIRLSMRQKNGLAGGHDLEAQRLSSSIVQAQSQVVVAKRSKPKESSDDLVRFRPSQLIVPQRGGGPS